MFGNFFSKKTQKSKQDSVEHVNQSAGSPQLTESEIQQVIEETLSHYRSGTFPQGILTLSNNVLINQMPNQAIAIELTLPFPCQGELDEIASSLTETLGVTVTMVITLAVNSVRAFSLGGCGTQVKNIIAVASGKGGVGKSTTTVNLAYALIAEGAKVGILDADIYGPSIPTLLGLKNAKPNSHDGKLMVPLHAYGLHAMSMGFLVNENDATVWRGPMASSAFNQLLNETSWPELDYLLIDMPPGTGDIQLTLAQKVPVAAAVVVTTPQDMALIDAAKGVAMFDTVKVPVLGIIENMSYHLCENCGHKSHIFGEAGGAEMAESKHTPLLGQLPLNRAIRQDADAGLPDIISNSTGEIATLYRKIARNIVGQLFFQLDNRSPLTPSVAVVNETTAK